MNYITSDYQSLNWIIRISKTVCNFHFSEIYPELYGNFAQRYLIKLDSELASRWQLTLDYMVQSIVCIILWSGTVVLCHILCKLVRVSTKNCQTPEKLSGFLKALHDLCMVSELSRQLPFLSVMLSGTQLTAILSNAGTWTITFF